MKQPLIIFTALATLAGPLTAGVLTPVQPNRQAEINGRKVEIQTLDLSTLPRSRAPQPAAPVGRTTDASRKRAGLKNGRLAQPTVAQSTLPRQTRPAPRVLVTNFTTKRAAESGQVVAAPTRPSTAAPISERRILANTPAGQDELKQQLNIRQ